MTYETIVGFGDCDPAGIVWYPRLIGWMDHAFHAALRPHGGHAAICARIGATGIGVVEVGATFRSPVRDGDLLRVGLRWEEWSHRTFRLCYDGRIGTRPAFQGRETRAIFEKDEDERMRAGTTDRFRAIIDG